MARTDSSLKVFLADDSALIRTRVAAMLAAPAMTIVGQGSTPRACIDGICASHPDVVVLDVQLEGGTGLDVLRGVREAAGTAGAGALPEFIVFSNNAEDAYRKRYLAEGAHVFLDKSTQFDQLAGAIAAAPRHRE
ncbi:MAG: response regulator [Pseudomonadota bacterium]